MLSERELIEEILAPLARADDGSLGLTDDAAFIACRDGFDLVVTQDTLLAEVHFRSSDPPDLVAQKALRVNLSDLAAKGAEPHSYFLSLGLPTGTDRAFAETFAAGLASDQRAYGIALYGGDTVRSPERLVISITVTGFVRSSAMVRRSGARPGDLVYVSGTIGDSTLGLAVLKGEEPALAGIDETDREFLTDRFLLPQPRTALAPLLVCHANAAMDVSDGLAGDLGLMVAASGVSATVEVPSVPMSDAARRAIAMEPALRERALCGGDDYEILCTVPAGAASVFEASAEAIDVPVTRIGTISEGAGPPRFIDEAGRALTFEHPSYAHF